MKLVLVIIVNSNNCQMYNHYKLVFLFFFSANFLFAQSDFNNQIDGKEKQYLQYYFDAEKHKISEEYNEALVMYEKCIAINSMESSAYNEIAKIYFYYQEWDNAEYYINEAIKRDNTNKWYYYLLIDLYVVQNKLDEQLDVYSILIDLEADNYMYFLQKLELLKELKYYKKAIRFIKKMQLKFGESADLGIQLKEVYIAQENFPQAEKTVLQLIEENPGDKIFLNELAALYMHFSKYNDAISTYIKLLNIDESDPISIVALYQIYSNKEDLPNQEKYLLKIIENKSINIDIKREIFYELLIHNKTSEYASFNLIIEKAVELYPDEPLFNLILADIYAKLEKYNDAIPHYKLALKSSLVKDLYIYNKLMEISFAQKDFDTVLQVANEAIEKHPYNSRLYYFKGLAWFNQNEYSQAIKTLLHGVDFIIDDKKLKSEFFSLIGDSYHQLENHQESDKAYEKSLKYNPDNIYVLNNYSYYLALREESLYKAKEMIIKCNTLTSDAPSASFLDTHAWVLYKLGEYDLAEQQIKHAIDIDNSNPTLLDHYGDILHKLGFLKKAIQNWKKAFSLDSSQQKIAEKIKMYE